MKILNFFRSKTVRVDNDRWEMFHYLDENNKTKIISFDTSYLNQADRDTASDEYSVIIHIPESHLNDDLPHPEENISLGRMENTLIRFLEEAQVDCKEVGRMTYDGKKVFVFETKNSKDFIAVCESWQSEMGAYVIETKLSSSAWSEYKEMLPNQYAWQQINDRKGIENLIREGYTTTKDYSIQHLFIGNDQELNELGKEIEKDGFKVLLDSGKLLLNKSCKLVQEDIGRDTRMLLVKIKEQNIEYQGWQLISS